jgi:hypothetical protein
MANENAPTSATTSQVNLDLILVIATSLFSFFIIGAHARIKHFWTGDPSSDDHRA